MSKILSIHPENPQARLVQQVVQGLQKNEVWVLPTDSAYVLAAVLDNKDAVARMRQIRGLDDKHFFTVICHHLSALSELAKVDNQQYRLLKLALPGPWTFILPATPEIPRRLAHPSRKTIGLRVPEHTVLQAILSELNAPLVVTTAMAASFEQAVANAEEFQQQFGKRVEGFVDSGEVHQPATTLIDLSVEPYQLLRLGQLHPEMIGLNID